MSKIRRLSVRGIRNFSDDREESVRFSCPLTLILGPNGTGKTTIIEALKYVTTGEFPPDSGKGKFFVHDPKLVTTGSVRGVVKAEIIDSMDNTYTVRRTVELQRSNILKTLENTITRASKDKKTSTSNRCIDIDAELSVALGVSKSILNYVIFCHQDELNWPFDTGKALKSRFDEIFDSTKYNKALDNVMMICKKLQGDIRGMNAEKQTFFLLVSEVEVKEAKLKEQKERLDTTKEKVDNINKKLEPLKQEIEEMQKLHSEYKNVQAEEGKKKTEYDVHRERYVKLKEIIQTVFEGTTEELNACIQSHERILQEKNNEIKENEAEIQGICTKETRISNTLAMRRETVGTLKQQMKDHERRIIQRNQLLDNALQACDFDAVGSDISEIEVKIFMKRLEEKIRTLEREVEENRLAMQRQEKELQKEVDTLRSNYSKIESEKLLKEREVTEIRDEVAVIRNQIIVIGEAGNKLKFLEQKLQAEKQRIEDLSRTLDVDCVKADIEKNIKSRDKIKINLDLVDEEISSLHKLSSITAEFELNKSALQAKEEELQNLRSKYEDDIKVLLNIHELPKTKLKNNLERVHQQLEKEINSLTREIQVQERKSTALETTVQHMESDIKKKRMEIEHDKQKISTVCDYKNFDETLLMQSKIVKDLQDKRGIYAYQATAYKEYIKKLSVEDPCCPLCHRDFQKQENVRDLIKEMESDIIHNQPNRLKKCEEELKIQQGKYDNMLQLKPIVENIISREKNELKKLDEKLEKTQNNLVQTKSYIMKLETSKAEPEKKLFLYKNITGDIQFWDWCIDEAQRLEKIVDNLQIQIVNAGVETEGTMEEAQKRRDRLNTSLKEAQNHIETLQDKLIKHNEKLQDAKAAYNKLYEQQLQIQSDMQRIKHLKDKQEDLYTREVSVGEAVEKLRENLTDAEDQLNSGIRRLEKIKAENWQKQEIERKSISENARRLLDLHKIIDEVDMFINSNVFEKLTNYEREIETYQNSLTEYANRKKGVEQTINKLKTDVASQEIEKRELLDNMTLRGIKETVETLKEQCKQLSVKLKNMNYNEITEKWEKLENEKQTLHRQKNVALGNQEELERMIQQYTQELQKEEYRMARRNYTNKCIELAVQEETIVNLKAYCKVLDVAMIDYHEERMATVNRIMKKLWKYVYKGTDTTSIHISTEPTKDVGSNKRTYNYKLIQTKHGCEMDMKGRCSAGQRVLASLITRLALAETFCKDCGILVLDEPTTNLDEENANSLADTLTRVVELRSRHQKNFQLIVISHDEKFLQKLADLNNHKRFYELYRKQNGRSAIKISDFNEPASSHMHIKDEDDSEEEEWHLNQSRNSPSMAGTSSGKRYNWDDFNEDERPAKKRYCFNE